MSQSNNNSNNSSSSSSSPVIPRSLITTPTIEKKKHIILQLRSTILEYSDSISSKTIELKSKRYNDINNIVIKKRISQYEYIVKNDHTKRPSDRTNDTKIITKLDRDLRQYSDLREWFNKYVPAASNNSSTITSTNVEYLTTPGYTLKVDLDS